MQASIARRLTSVSVGQEQDEQGLVFVPIVGPSHEEPAYRLLEDEVLDAVKVTEVDEEGSVSELRIQNTLDVHVFLMDGQELVGAKQNRILNTDVLVPAKTTLIIPVSCIEQGRWDYTQKSFSPSGQSASNLIRTAKAKRVHDSLKTRGRHDADQSAVWSECAAELQASAACSPTAALNDAYEKRSGDLKAVRQRLSLPDNAVGLAMFRGGRFKGLDLFDRHSTLKYFWESLVDSYALTWLEVREPEVAASESRTIGQVIENAADGKWERFDVPGDGQDYRLEDPAMSGSGLVWEDQVVVHLQLFPLDNKQQSPNRPRLHRRYARR